MFCFFCHVEYENSPGERYSCSQRFHPPAWKTKPRTAATPLQSSLYADSPPVLGAAGMGCICRTTFGPAHSSRQLCRVPYVISAQNQNQSQSKYSDLKIDVQRLRAGPVKERGR